jgi:exonuclease III
VNVKLYSGQLAERTSQKVEDGRDMTPARNDQAKESLVLTIKLRGSPDDLQTSARRNALVSDVARALQMPLSQISLTRVVAGSIVATFAITCTSPSHAAQTSLLAQQLPGANLGSLFCTQLISCIIDHLTDDIDPTGARTADPFQSRCGFSGRSKDQDKVDERSDRNREKDNRETEWTRDGELDGDNHQYLEGEKYQSSGRDRRAFLSTPRDHGTESYRSPHGQRGSHERRGSTGSIDSANRRGSVSSGIDLKKDEPFRGNQSSRRSSQGEGNQGGVGVTAPWHGESIAGTAANADSVRTSASRKLPSNEKDLSLVHHADPVDRRGSTNIHAIASPPLTSSSLSNSMTYLGSDARAFIPAKAIAVPSSNVLSATVTNMRFYHFSTASSHWVAIKSRTANDPSNEHRTRSSKVLKDFRCITFNVCCSEPYFGQQRLKSLLQCLETLDADIICLQSVSATLARALAKQNWVKENYFMSDFHAALLGTHALLILSRIPPLSLEMLKIEFEPPPPQPNLENPTIDSQFVLCAHFNINNERLAVMTFCISANLSSATSLQRIIALADNDDTTIMMGDFGVDMDVKSEEFLIRVMEPDFIDAWRLLRPFHQGFTVDSMRNGMLRKNRRVRCDRALFRCRTRGSNQVG